MNNVNKVKFKVKAALFVLLKKKRFSDIGVKEIIDVAEVSRASFYRNYKNMLDVLFDYFRTTFADALMIINDTPYATGVVLREILTVVSSKKEEFILLNKNRCLAFLVSFFKKNLDFSYFGNNFKTNALIGCAVSLIGSWIDDNFQSDPEDVITTLNKLTIFDDNLLHIPSKSAVVLSNQTMRDSDKRTIESGVPSKDLMFRAGEAVFKSHKWIGKIAVVCGKGNNAGDGYVLAYLLKKNKYNVELLRIGSDLSKDGELYFNLCKMKGVKTIYIDETYSFDKYDVIVDAIFGTGFKGEVKEPYRSVIQNINTANKYVVSIDINSGLNGDNGLCDIAVKSNMTISIGSYKAGLFLNKAKDYIGALKLADIGIKPIKDEYLILGTDDVKKCIKKRENFSNKGSYGYVALIGGSSQYSGAVKLANLATSSLRMGAGVTLLGVPKSISDNLLTRILESTVYPMDDKNGQLIFNSSQLDFLIKRCKTIAIGMGLGQSNEINKIIAYLLEHYKGNLIIDADGLNALSKIDQSLLDKSDAKVILTPHIKEFSRLSGYSIDEIFVDSLSLAKEYAFKHKCIVLLKGPTTIVTDGDHVYLTNRGTAGMATAGSGDVLSGILASIVSYNDDLLLSVAAGSYINGIAGELAENFSNDISMTSGDTINNISKAIAVIRNN